MESRQIYINGSYHKSNSDKWLEVENPATKQIIARVPRSNAEDVNQAVAAASAAFPKWSASPVSERIAIMKRF
ncbi:MAG: aldehyde dehydrogenase family protein, partial [Eubacteriales bacterium]|nr:aldehyde dehydrogenase family protein [Eubacteriales bacterium]